MNWKDPALAAQLKKLWNEGHSASTIARMMGGVTRNAVIGAVRRADLPYRGHSGNRSSRGRSRSGDYAPSSRNLATITCALERRVLAGKRPDARSVNTAVRASVASGLADGLPLPSPAETDIARIATVDLEPHHCRFPCVPDVRNLPINAPIFCGAPKVNGLSYCNVHSRRAYSIPHQGTRDHRPSIKVVEHV